MTVFPHVRRYWRELTLVCLWALPTLSLAACGVLWLADKGHLLTWAALLAAVAVAAVPIRRALRRHSLAQARQFATRAMPPDPSETPREKQARAEVERVIAEIGAVPLGDQEAVLAAVRRVVEAAARSLNPGKAEPWAETTVPTALLLVEQTASELRRIAVRNVPFVRGVTLGHLLALRTLHGKAAPLLDKALWLYRTFRVVKNPPAAALREAANKFVGDMGGKFSALAWQHIVQLLLQAVGRKAVELYGGRLDRSVEELREAAKADFSDAAKPAGPIRILLAGQVNAGKSSLVNALAGEVRAQESILQQTAEVKEHQLQVDGHPAVHVAEMLGLSGDAGERERLLEAAAQADLLLWVASAIQPARAPDTAALSALRAAFAGWHDRNPPPMRLVLTHVDRLPPGREWAPPYDLRASQGKGRSIAQAAAAIEGELGFDKGSAIPVCTALPSWNLDSVWLAVASSLPVARSAQLGRLRLKQGAPLGEAWGVAGEGLGNAARLLKDVVLK